MASALPCKSTPAGPADTQSSVTVGGVGCAFRTKAALAQCAHGWCLAAGFLSAPSAAVCTATSCVADAQPWWRQRHVAVACPHGFVADADEPAPPRLCLDPACILALHVTVAAARRSILELPARDDPIRWPNELLASPDCSSLPEPPAFTAVAAHEHTHAFAAAWAAHGVLAASLADRPSCVPPPPGSVHYIARCQDWFAWYPHPIPFASFHPNCGPFIFGAPNSAAARWTRHLISGSLRSAAEHAVWCLNPRRRVALFALEQPPTALQFIIGPPTVQTSLAEFGVPRKKQWWWWQSASLPVVRGSDPAPPNTVVDRHHEFDHLDADRRSIARSPTPPSFAAAHVTAWLDTVTAVARSSGNPDEPPPPVTEAAAIARLTLFAAARLVPRLSLPLPDLAVLVVPAFRAADDVLALMPTDAFFGRPYTAGDDLDAAVAHIGRLLSCSAEPMLAHVAATASGRHLVYVCPADAAPLPHELAFESVAWIAERTLADSELRLYVALALHKFRQAFEPVYDARAVFGASGPPQPLVASAEATA